MGWKTKERQREYNRKYYLKNKEKILNRNKKWVESNKEKVRIKMRKWYLKNREKTAQEMFNSKTSKGYRMEKLACRILKGAVNLNDTGFNKPYDLDWKGRKIDVKSKEVVFRKFKRGKPVKKSQSGFWSFKRTNYNCDYFFCICLENGNPIKFYLFPSKAFGKGVCIGRKSKYDNYLFNN
jgi:hypothetical protein